MVAATASGLLYPSGTDRPCDSWETWQRFGLDLDSRLSALDVDVARAAGRPFAKVSTVTPQQLTLAEDLVAFDTVLADTDGMVDLNRLPEAVVPQRPGIYLLEAWGTLNNLDTGAVWSIYIVEGGSGIEGGIVTGMQNWAKFDAGTSVRAMVEVPTAGDFAYGISMSATGVTGDDPRCTAAMLSIAWMADL